MECGLAGLVEALTTAGGPEPEPRRLKELKRLCRTCPEQVERAHRLLMAQLAAPHAEIRLAAFRVLEELFGRSHRFRASVVAELPELLALTVETEHERPLPPPAPAAQQLKRAALSALRGWHDKYGQAYKKLALGYHFLAHNKKVDFQDINARTQAERRRAEEKQKHLDRIYKNKAQRAEKEMEDMSPEIQAVLTEMENCFRLLMPDPYDFTVNNTEAMDWKAVAEGDQSSHSSVLMVNHSIPFIEQMGDEQPCCSKDLPSISCAPEVDSGDSDSEVEKEEAGQEDCSESELTSGCRGGDDGDDAAFLRSHGLGSHKYSLSLEIATDTKLEENENNTAIISNITDSHKLIRNKFLPSVQSWIQVFTRAGINDDRLRKAIDLKNTLETALEKHKELNIDCKEKRKVMKASDDSSDNEEFVEVPEKEGYEPHIPDHLRKEYGLEPLSPPKTLRIEAAGEREPKQNEEELDPTCAAATWKIIRDKVPRVQSPNTRNSELATSGENDHKREEEKSKAPFVPFGLDLFYWGQEQPAAGKLVNFSSLHRFWTLGEMEEEAKNKEVEGMGKSRCITFAGKFEPVQHKCRAPMPNGGLCGRQDRFKCPFHGKIIPRDELGNPVNQEDRDREAKEQFEKKEKQPEWKDPEFMREVEAATGCDLGSSRYSGKGGKKGKKKKYPNLTDLKQQANTSRSRLGKKVFDKTAVKRVVKAMNRIDQRKHEKFANQFNYALN